MKIQTKLRLIKEFKEIKKNSTEDLMCYPLKENIFIWCATIIGPVNSPYSGILVKVQINFSENYPYDPPTIYIRNRHIIHPNIYSNGKVCIDILNKKWSPVYSNLTLLLSLKILLEFPNSESPANLRATNLFNRKKKLYNKYNTLKTL